MHGPAAADHMVVDDVGSDSTASMLLQEVPRVVKAASRQLREKSVKTRVAALHCMRQLVTRRRQRWVVMNTPSEMRRHRDNDGSTSVCPLRRGHRHT